MNRIIIKKVVCLVLVFSAFSFSSVNFTRVYSNPIPTYGEMFGGVLTGNTSLCMQQAEVLFNLDIEHKGREFHINFFGNYSIFNPNDTDITLCIYNPIFSKASGLSNSSNIQIFANDVSVNFLVLNKLPDTVNLTYTRFQVKNGYAYHYYGYQYIVCNVTFKAKSTTLLRYIVKYNLYFYGECNLYFSYYVGSAREWSGNTTETVTFIIKGKQPEHYTANCSLIKTSRNTYQYQWHWENEYIIENDVYVHFSIHFFDFFEFLGLEFLIQAFIGLPAFIIYAIVKIAKTKEFDV